MPPKKGSIKKAAIKLASPAADVEVFNNIEKELTVKHDDDANDLPNGVSIQDTDDTKQSANSKTARRNSGRTKNVAPVVDVVSTPGKKPATKGRGKNKKKSNENEVMENEIDGIQLENQFEETKASEELSKKKPKGRGGGKKAGPKAKNVSKTKEDVNGVTSVEELQEDDSKKDAEMKVTEKKPKAVSGKKKKQERESKMEEQSEIKQEIKEEIAEEKVSVEVEPQKKKSRVVKNEKSLEDNGLEEGLSAKSSDKVKENKPTKRSRTNAKTVNAAVEEQPLDVNGDTEAVVAKKRSRKAPTVEKAPAVTAAVEETLDVNGDTEAGVPKKRSRKAPTIEKAPAVTAAVEETDVNGDTEEGVPKKRSRKAPTVEKEILKEKPKKGRGKKVKDEIVEIHAAVMENEEENETNGQVKEEEIAIKKESSSINEADGQIETVTPTGTGTAKTKGGRKRAAPSSNNKKKLKKTEEDDVGLDDVVDNAELDNSANDSKPNKAKKSKTNSAPLNTTVTKYDKADFDLPPPIDGQDVEEPRFNYKISSWNVAGLRSWIKKDGLKFLEYEQPDIFCMQETKCSNDQLPEEVVRIPGYHPYWLCMPGGYAGVAIYSKIMPINVEYGIGNKQFDNCGRIITAEYEKFFLINVYVPNSGRKLVNLEDRMKWEILFQQFVQDLDARKPVVICGDMNVSHQEHDLANPKSNTKNAGFTKEERDKMTELLALGYVDTFRELYPERKGAYTFWSYMGNARSRNIGWRLDYFIVSERFMKRVVDNCIRSQCMGSDHCPITLFLKL